MKPCAIAALACFVFQCTFGQESSIENYLAKIENGQTDEVRAALPSLLKSDPNNPGVLYLQALLTTDGAEAVRMYQNIVDTYPKSEWSDDALWKTYKFYSAIGLHRTAEIKLNQLKTSYPDSQYLTGRVQESPAVVEQKVEPGPGTVTQNQNTGAATKPESNETTPGGIAAKPGDVTPKEETIRSEGRDPEPSRAEAGRGGTFTLQVGVYSSAANANRQAQFFEYQKYPARIVSRVKGGKELLYVYVGNFPTAADARAKGDEMKRLFNIGYFVVAQ